MTNNLEDEIRAIVARMDNQESQDNTQTPQEEIQDVYVLIVREQKKKIKRRLLRARPHPQLPLSKTRFFPRMSLCVSHCFLFFPHLLFQLLLHDKPAQ